MSMGALFSWIMLARYSGWLALLFLAAALSVSPARAVLHKLGRERGTLRWLVRVRRTLGIASAVLATLHALVAISRWHDPVRGGLGWLFDTAYIRWGVTGLLILLLLLLTSFPKVVRALHVRGWQELHRLAYGAFACAILHALLSPFAPRLWILGLTAWIAILATLRIALRAWRG